MKSSTFTATPARRAGIVASAIIGPALLWRLVTWWLIVSGPQTRLECAQKSNLFYFDWCAKTVPVPIKHPSFWSFDGGGHWMDALLVIAVAAIAVSIGTFILVGIAAGIKWIIKGSDSSDKNE